MSDLEDRLEETGRIRSGTVKYILPQMAGTDSAWHSELDTFYEGQFLPYRKSF